MAASTTKLIQIVQEGQGQMLEYLKRADERAERQSRAIFKALAAIQEGQNAIQDGQKVLHEGRKAIAQMLLENQTTKHSYTS